MTNNLFVYFPLLIFLFFPTYIFPNQLKFGLKSGIIYSELDHPSSWATKYSPMFGFDIGIDLSVNIFRAFFLETDIRYSPRGYILPGIEGRDVYGMPTNTFDAKYRIQCISFPILLNYRLNNTFFVSGGPRFDYLINEDFIIDNWSSRDKLNKLDIGYDLGVGIIKSIGNKLVSSVEFRFSPTISKYEGDTRFTACELLFGLEYHKPYKNQ